MKINLKLLIIILEISLIPLFFLGFVTYSNSKNQLIDGVVNKLEAIAQIQKNRLQDNINDANSLLSLFNTKPQLRAYLNAFNDNPTPELQKNIHDNIVEAKGDSLYIKKVLVINPAGIVVASTDTGLLETDVSTKKFFTQGIQRADVSFIIKNAQTQEIERYLVSPLLLHDKIIGMTALIVNADDVNFLVNDYTGLGDTGETLLVENDGNDNALFLTPSRFDEVASLTRIVSKTDIKIAAVHAILGEENIFLDAQDYKGNEVFAVTRYIPSVGWGIVTKIDKSEALLPIQRLKGLLLFIFLISAILIFLISYSVSQSITDPIFILKQLANKIASGNLSERIEVSGNDEISELAVVFNIMATKLKESYATLEKKVFDRTKDLKMTLVKNEAILANIGEGVAVADEQGKLIYLNKNASDIIGDTTNNDLPGTWQEKFGIFDPITFKPFPTDNMPLLRAVRGEVLDKIIMFVKNPLAPEGRFISVTARPIVLSDGQSIGGVAVFSDMSKEKEIDRQKSEFISLASHQLRTPLGSMRWNLELLKSEATSLPSAMQERLNETYQSNLRAIRLVGDLLSVARIEQNRVNDEPVPTNIIDIIKSAVKEIGPEAKAKSIKIGVKVKKLKIPNIVIDPKFFREVIQNLLSNAVKYTLTGGQVSVNIDGTVDTILLTVADNGIGIPEKEKSKIFTRFARAENAARIDTGGSGLGLYIVKSFVEKWGGKVWFESEQNKGTTFYVSLPLVPNVIHPKVVK